MALSGNFAITGRVGGLPNNLGNANKRDKQTRSKAKYGAVNLKTSALWLLKAAAQGPAVLGTKGSTSCAFNRSRNVIERRLFAQSTNWMLPSYWWLLVLHMPLPCLHGLLE